MKSARIFIYEILAIWFVLLAVSLQFERPEFRPWEILYDAKTLRFKKNRRVEMSAIGDLGHKSWVRDLQQSHTVVFSTDNWGFRNPPNMVRPSVVVLGDSFIAGSSVSDHQTLPFQLMKMLREPVYNYGLQTLNTPALFLQDNRFLAHPPQVVIYAPVARALRPRSLVYRRKAAPGFFAGMFEAYGSIGRIATDFNRTVIRDNGLARRAKYAYNGLLERLFGCPGQIEVFGKHVLALSIVRQALNIPPAERQVERVSEMIYAMAQLLSRRGSYLIFCPIPGPGSIYPESYPLKQRELIVKPSFLDVLVEKVARKGVDVVDLRKVFRANRGPYLYGRDDSHWNPRAIKLAAEVLYREVEKARRRSRLGSR